MAAVPASLHGAGPLTPDAYGRERLRMYKHIRFLGKGAFADVSQYEELGTGRQVAIKRVVKDTYKSGINLGALKELHALRELAHTHITALRDVFSYGDRIHLVLEYGACDLSKLIHDMRIAITEADAKAIMQGVLRGLAHIHACHFLHRDLKPDNILITPEGTVKLADFGHATRFSDGEKPVFHRVITIWYRAPELLMECKYHGPAVDMWSVGCILAELVLRQPLFPGDETEADQLAHIYRLLGTPSDPAPPWAYDAAAAVRAAASASGPLRSNGFVSPSIASIFASPAELAPTAAGAAPVKSTAWPHVTCLPAWAEFDTREAQPWRTIMSAAVVPHSPLLVDLLSKMLELDPSRRISAADALRHPWFSTDPFPTPPGKIPLPKDAIKTASELAPPSRVV